MPTLVESGLSIRTIVFTAAELGFTTALLGAGTKVALVDKLPKGWSVRTVNVKALGTITNGSGTTVLNVGTDAGSFNDIVSAVDIEGAIGWRTVTTVRYDNTTAPIAIVAQVVTATAAATVVAGLAIAVDLVKYSKE